MTTNDQAQGPYYRKPTFIVTNHEGRPMGRMNLSDSFGPVPLQFSACYPLTDAVMVAEQIGGQVRPAPIFDERVREWVIPSTENLTAQ